MEDVKFSLNDTLSLAVIAKNTLTNVHGHSPNQLVFGKNPNFLTVLHDKLTALDDTLKSEILLNNLNALYSVYWYGGGESDPGEFNEWIQYTSRVKTKKNFTLQIFHNGDSVYYKRDDVYA